MTMRNKLRDARFLVGLTAALVAIVVQSGELGSADTMHRLQTAHSFWTSEPPVFPNEYPEFGLYGRGGKLYDWYGMGQSLLMLPMDVVATGIERLPVFSSYRGNDPTVRSIVVSYSTNILVNVLTALVCLRFLLLLGFDTRESTAGVLALLCCTTHLHYTQNMMENNYIMLLTLTGFAFQCEWVRSGEPPALLIGSAALGLNLLTRLTTVLDLVAGGLLVVLLLAAQKSGVFWKRLFTYLKTGAPVYMVFMLIDRWYQYQRFGSFFTTYVSLFAQKYKQLDPSLPPAYPFETPFRVGFLGPLITPEKSIFLFDPLIVLTIVISVLIWKGMQPELKAYLITGFVLVISYICFYAKYTVWSGDFAWGDRYVSTAVQFGAFVSVPLLLRYRAVLARPVRTVGIALIVVSLVIQLASLAFWLPLEIYQMETMGHLTFVIGLRFKNIAAFALGKMEAWGLNNHAMTEDPWDYVHITTWNFLPFVLRRVGEAPRWVVDVAFAFWGLSIALLALVLRRLIWMIRTKYADSTGNKVQNSIPY
jgi:hypothetical protein